MGRQPDIRPLIPSRRFDSQDSPLFPPLISCDMAATFERKTMLQLTEDTERLARQVAARMGRQPEEAIRTVLEREAKALGVPTEPPTNKRMTVEQMLALGDKMTALPLLDPRSPQEIADDLNEP